MSAQEIDSEQVARAIGSLIWKDPERLVDFATRLRGSDTVIECRLRGGSMEPAIPRGASLRINLGRVAPYRVGEIVVFVQDAGLCVHRVAFLGRSQRARDYIITQGDACFHPDPPIRSSRVLGAVTHFRLDGDWIPTDDQASAGRARSFLGRTLLKLIAGLMERDIPLGQRAAKFVRVRKERAPPRPS